MTKYNKTNLEINISFKLPQNRYYEDYSIITKQDIDKLLETLSSKYNNYHASTRIELPHGQSWISNDFHIGNLQPYSVQKEIYDAIYPTWSIYE